MDIVILKPDVKVSVEGSKNGSEIRLGASEIFSNARIIASINEVENVYIFTTTSRSPFKVFEKVWLVDLMDTMMFKSLNKEPNVLLSWCGYFNFFGGVPIKTFVVSYALMHDWNHRKAYIVTDNRAGMWPQNIIKYYEKKLETENESVIAKWNDYKSYIPKLNFNDWVDKTDLLVQSRNLDYIKELISSKPVNNFKSIQHISLEWIPLFTHITKPIETFQNECIFSSQNFKTLGTYRMKLLQSYVNVLGDDLTLVGDNPEKVYEILDKKPKCKPGVNYFKFKELLQVSKSQIILSEKEYELADLVPNRIAEGIATNTVNFINISVNPSKNWFNDTTIKDFCYISNIEDIKDRLKALNFSLYKDICLKQKSDIGLNKREELKNEWLNYFKYGKTN